METVNALATVFAGLLDVVGDAIAERVAKKINAGVIPTPPFVGSVGTAGEAPAPIVAAPPVVTAPVVTAPVVGSALVADELDKTGVKYDPAIHSSSKAMNADGTWRRKRGLAKEGAADVAAPVPSPAPTPVPVPAATDLSDLFGDAPAPAPTPVLTKEAVIAALKTWVEQAGTDPAAMQKRRDAAFALIAEFRDVEFPAISAATLNPAKYGAFLARLALAK